MIRTSFHQSKYVRRTKGHGEERKEFIRNHHISYYRIQRDEYTKLQCNDVIVKREGR